MEDATAALQEHVRSKLDTLYDVERELDHGATSHVYRALDRRHQRAVAIKVLRAEVARTVGAERFLREIRTAAQLQHPHIVPVFDSGASSELYYYVMPLIEGESLAARLRRERQLPLSDALRISREVADALAYAHSRGLVHRDIKPANVLLTGEHAAVTDFGIARALEEPEDRRLTGGSIVVGTPAYMSPEQASGDRSVDGRTDIYALGCVLYEMLVGTPPFDGSDAQVVLSQHRHDVASPIRTVRPELPVSVDALVGRMLAKTPADRLGSAVAVRDQIDELLLALGTSELQTRRPLIAHSRVAPLVGGIAAVLLLGVGWWFLADRVQRHTPDPNRVLVFPLQDIRGGDAGNDGLAVATYIGYALDGTRPLRWIEAQPLLANSNAGANVSQRQARSLARSIGAGYYIDGAIVREPDSVAVILRLHSTLGDSLVRREGVSGPVTASVAQLGVRAVAAMVPSLVEPGRTVDYSPLRDRRAPAIAKFLQGERAYRASRLQEALALYREAVSIDSIFALAAIKGALAARAMDHDSSASELHAVAIRHVDVLPPRQAIYARGLGHYLSGQADSALAQFRDVLASDSAWADVWLAMAETYHHLLPNVASAESLAANAYAQALERDTTLLLARMHLAEHDMQEGRLTSRPVRFALAADTSGVSRLVTPLKAALSCATSTSPGTYWTDANVPDTRSLLHAGKLLASGASQAPCARAALWRVLHTSDADVATRWGALLTLQGLLIATNDTASLAAAYAAGTAAGLPVWPLRLLAAAAGVDDARIADSIALSRGSDFKAMNSATLWLRSQWSARQGDRATAREIANVLAERAHTSHVPQDSALARSTAALLAVSERDTVMSVARLRQLRPQAPRADITWQPFAAHGLERLTLAQLLAATRRFDESERVASLLDAPEPVTYLLYYRQSLALRVSAARALGNAADARSLTERLNRLQPAGPPLGR